MSTTEQSGEGWLKGRVCVIAGAGGAIGEAVARRLQREGGAIVGIDRNPHAVGDLQLIADLTNEDEVRTAYRRVRDTFGRLDVLYNNAGLTDPTDRSALSTPSEVWERVFAANFTTTLLSCKYGIPIMLGGRPARGSVINTASFLSGMGAASAQMAFSAAKAAVAQLSRDLGVSLARSGVRVNALGLGPIETPQLAPMFDRIGPEQAARRFTHVPMGRFGTLEELAATVAYLASDDAGFVTASIIPINGGVPGAFTVPK